jgi:uncharacterized protein YlzI (FlbEa/FlbD family)
MNPIIIKLTRTGGEKIWLNANIIATLTVAKSISGDPITKVCLTDGENEFYVKERPEHIIEMIGDGKKWQ